MPPERRASSVKPMNFAISGTRRPRHPISSPAAAKRLKRMATRKAGTKARLKTVAALPVSNAPMPVAQTAPKIRRPTAMGRTIATRGCRRRESRSP
jgi:hypothetical protein